MMKTQILGLLLLISFLKINAQNKTDVMLFGDVKSAETKEHIPFSTITVKGINLGTVADLSGHFKLPHLPVGKVTLIVQSMGYKSQEHHIETEKGQTINLFFELEEDVLNIQQVVVTGTRTEHFIKDVPVRTEVITAQAIENKNAGNLYQALEGIPGIRVENQCSYCNFTMIRMQGLGAEHTQVLIDGQPMYSGLAGVYGLQQLSTVDVDKIEVVKGAGSALYGSGAIAGAINIVTKEPGFVPQTSLGLQMGNYGTHRFDINSSMRNEKGNVGLSIHAQRYGEGVIDQTGTGFNRSEVRKQDGISDRVLTNLTNAGFGLYINNAFLNNDQLVLRGKSVFEKREGGTLVDDYFRNPLTDGTENITTDRYEASMAYKKTIGQWSELNFNLAFVNHNRNATNDSYLGDYMATHADSIPDLRDMRPYLAVENSLTSTLSYSSAYKQHRFILGAQVFSDQLEESGMYVVVDEDSPFFGESYRSVADKSAREFGIFAQDEWMIGEHLMIVPGIRFDWHDSGEKYLASKQVFVNNEFPETHFNESAFNPRIAIKYALTDDLIFRANVGTGFRAPYGFSEDLHLCSGSPRVWKSSDLQAETSVSINLSADYYGKKFRISTNLFSTNLKNQIAFTEADPAVAALGFDYQWRNIDDAFVNGVEFSLVANLVKNLDLGIDLTINQGEYNNVREDWIGTSYEELSRFISRFPQSTADIKLEYSPKSWNLILSSSYQGMMYIDYYNSEVNPLIGDLSKIKKTPPYTLVNLKMMKKFEAFKLQAGVNNLFNYVQDERYMDDAAFLYAPVYGTLFYAGFSLDITH